MGCIQCENSQFGKEQKYPVKESFIDFPQNTPLSEIEPSIESKYLFEDSINGGKFGFSMKIRNKVTKQIFRLKILHKTSLLKFKRTYNVINYYKDMINLDNKFVNKIIGVYQNCDNILPVCDYSPKENLYYYLNTKKKISLEEFLFLIKCIIDGLKYLNDKGYIHGHLILQNIILFEDNNPYGYIPKITDYSHYINFYDNNENELKSVKDNIEQFLILYEKYLFKYIDDENIKEKTLQQIQNKNFQTFDSIIEFCNTIEKKQIPDIN